MAQTAKNLPANAGDLGLIPEMRRSTREANGYLLQYSCLENSTDRGAWWAPVHEVAKSGTRLSDKAQHSTLWNLVTYCVCGFSLLHS